MLSPDAFQIQSDHAVFIPFQSNTEILRHMSLQALRNGVKSKRFIICDEKIYYYSHALDRLLCNEAHLNKALNDMEPGFDGEIGGAICCALIWNNENGEGFLVHRDSKKLLLAFVPIINEEVLLHIQRLQAALNESARIARAIPFKTIPHLHSEPCSFSTLLEDLSLSLRLL